jgi:hypothetical protein
MGRSRRQLDKVFGHETMHLIIRLVGSAPGRPFLRIDRRQRRSPPDRRRLRRTSSRRVPAAQGRTSQTAPDNRRTRHTKTLLRAPPRHVHRHERRRHHLHRPAPHVDTGRPSRVERRAKGDGSRPRQPHIHRRFTAVQHIDLAGNPTRSARASRWAGSAGTTGRPPPTQPADSRRAAPALKGATQRCARSRSFGQPKASRLASPCTYPPVGRPGVYFQRSGSFRAATGGPARPAGSGTGCRRRDSHSVSARRSSRPGRSSTTRSATCNPPSPTSLESTYLKTGTAPSVNDCPQLKGQPAYARSQPF